MSKRNRQSGGCFFNDLFIFGVLGSLLGELFSNCGKHWLALAAVHRLFTAVASLVLDHGLQLAWASGL